MPPVVAVVVVFVVVAVSYPWRGHFCLATPKPKPLQWLVAVSFRCWAAKPSQASDWPKADDEALKVNSNNKSQHEKQQQNKLQLRRIGLGL